MRKFGNSEFSTKPAWIDEIGNEFQRHSYVLQADALLPIEKERYENLMNQKAGRS